MADETSSVVPENGRIEQGGSDDSHADRNPVSDEEGSNVRARVVAQFIRDLSFECPKIERLLEGPGDNPNLNIEVNVNARHLNEDLYESAVEFKAKADNAGGVIYHLEIVYGGMFQIENLPPEALEGFLLVNCPALLFPFLRRIVADLTRESGFPPLFLDPIDFGALYMQKQQQMREAKVADGAATNPLN
ncbi:MAG: protein-export chaperone SecB [Hyphomicrobiaceae bacterium]